MISPPSGGNHAGIGASQSGRIRPPVPAQASSDSREPTRARNQDGSTRTSSSTNAMTSPDASWIPRLRREGLSLPGFEYISHSTVRATCELLHDLACLILGVVIDDQQLPTNMSRRACRQHAFHRLRQLLASVVGTQNDRDLHRVIRNLAEQISTVESSDYVGRREIYPEDFLADRS
jgi:hypothetical protein